MEVLSVVLSAIGLVIAAFSLFVAGSAKKAVRTAETRLRYRDLGHALVRLQGISERFSDARGGNTHSAAVSTLIAWADVAGSYQGLSVEGGTLVDTDQAGELRDALADSVVLGRQALEVLEAAGGQATVMSLTEQVFQSMLTCRHLVMTVSAQLAISSDPGGP